MLRGLHQGIPDIFADIEDTHRDIAPPCLPENYCSCLPLFPREGLKDSHLAGVEAADDPRIFLLSLKIGEDQLFCACNVKKGLHPFILPGGGEEDNRIVVIEAGELVHPDGIDQLMPADISHQMITDGCVAGRN